MTLRFESAIALRDVRAKRQDAPLTVAFLSEPFMDAILRLSLSDSSSSSSLAAALFFLAVWCSLCFSSLASCLRAFCAKYVRGCSGLGSVSDRRTSLASSDVLALEMVALKPAMTCEGSLWPELQGDARVWRGQHDGDLSSSREQVQTAATSSE